MASLFFSAFLPPLTTIMFLRCSLAAPLMASTVDQQQMHGTGPSQKPPTDLLQLLDLHLPVLAVLVGQLGARGRLAQLKVAHTTCSLVLSHAGLQPFSISL